MIQTGRDAWASKQAARDLAICRAVRDFAYAYGSWRLDSEQECRAIIAAVDASLGVSASIREGETALSADAAQAAEPPGDDIVWPDTKIVTTVNPYANGYREAKREAVGIMRELVDGTASEAVFVAALQYIAAFEAEQEKGEG
jgi:hypothetical protein